MDRSRARLDLAKIVDRRPGWLVRWGITALWGLALILGLGYYILNCGGAGLVGP